MPTIGQILHARREAMGLSLAQLAGRVGLAKGYLSMIENHRLDNPPSDKALRRLAAAIEVDPAELIEAAQWQRTPSAVRDRLQAMEAQLRAHESPAITLRATTRGDGLGRDLDALYRSGELARQAGATPAADRSVMPPRPDASSGDAVAMRYNVPLINKVAAGRPADFTDLDYPASVADAYVPSPRTGDPDAFATRIAGDSMWPMYRAGDIVIFSPAAALTDGCDCFVRLEPDHESTFKRVFFLAGEDKPPRRADEPMDIEAATHIRLHPLNEKYPARTVPREQVAGLFRAVWRFEKL
jgi:transcriptional regulator with XRE-family HTH domain